MARYMYAIRLRTFLALIALVLLLVLFGFVAPAVLGSYPVAGPLGMALAWTGDKFMQGLTTLALMSMVHAFYSLARDAQRWCISTPHDAPTAVELEDGTARRARSVEVGSIPSTPIVTLFNDPIINILRFATTFLFLYSQLSQRDIVSYNASHLEKVGAVLLFLLRGLEVILVLLLFVCWLAWKHITSAVPLEATTGVPVSPDSAAEGFSDSKAMEPAERERAWVLRSTPLGVNTTTRYMYTARPKAFLILIGLVLFGFVAPAVLESSSVAAAGPAGAAFTWSGAKFMQGLTTLAFIRMVFSLCSLACDAQGWFTSATEHAPTPAELEDGTAQCPHGVEPAWTTATEDPILKVARTAATFIFVCFQLFRGDVVSGQNPLMENVGAVLLFLLRGLEVILVEGLLLVFVLWLKGITREVVQASVAATLKARIRPVAASPPPVESVFDSETMPKEDAKGAMP